MSRHHLTPSQTIGPFLHIGLPWVDGPLVVAEGTPEAIRITGAVYDGAGDPVADALVETWQADPAGRFAHPDDPRAPTQPLSTGFRGFGRCPTDGNGEFWLLTAKPGTLPCPADVDDDTATSVEGAAELVEAPHLNVSVFARGLLEHLVTRIYFPDEEAANAADPVLNSIADPARRRTLVAAATAEGYRFDIRLQGLDETVFFDV